MKNFLFWASVAGFGLTAVALVAAIDAREAARAWGHVAFLALNAYNLEHNR